MESPLSPAPVEGRQQPLDSPNTSRLSLPLLGHRSNMLPTRRLIDFKPLRQPNTTYQHGRDSPVWGQQQPLNPTDAPELPRRSSSADPFVSSPRLMDYGPFSQPKNATYQHGRDSPVWGQQQPLNPTDVPELPQQSSQSADPFVSNSRPVNYEPFRIPHSSPRHGLDSPVWGDELYLESPDAYPPKFDIVYTNGWIHQVPIHPMNYEYRMLPIQASQHGRGSPVSRGSEHLSINGPKDPHKSKRPMVHDRSTSIERACKAWADELTNKASNSKPIDADTDSLFGSLERLETCHRQNQPGTEVPPRLSVKQQPTRYKIRKSSRKELPKQKDDIEDLPYWARDRLGIRLPPGMVNLAQLHLPAYLVRKLKNPLRYLPSKLSFKENFPFGNVIPKKGQIGIHPTFRTIAPDDILKAEKELELTKERQFVTPVEAWRSPIIDEYDSDAGRESLTAYELMTIDDRATSPNDFQVFERSNPETHSRSADEETEPFPDVGLALMFSIQDMESPDMGPVTMFSGLDIESDQNSIILGPGMESPVSSVSMLYMKSPIKDQVAMAPGQEMESPNENKVSRTKIQDLEIENRNSETEDQDTEYFGQDMEYSNENPFLMLYGEDIEHLFEDQDSISSNMSTEPSIFLHEDLPIIRWFFDYWESKTPPLGQPSSSNQNKETKEHYKRNSADFAYLPPIDFTKSYKDFYTTQFGRLITGGGLNDYNSANEETVQKTTEETENPRVPTDTYGAKDHEARMQELFAEIEQEGASRILTTWQEVYAERADEEETEEVGADEEQVETVLEDSKGEINIGPAVPLGQRSSETASWLRELPAEKEDKKGRRKSQGAELELNGGKRMRWLGGLDVQKEEQTQKSSKESVSYVTQSPTDPLVRKNSKRVTWFGGLSTEKRERAEEEFNSSKKKINPGLVHPLKQTQSKRTSWVGEHPAEKNEQTKGELEDSHGKLTEASAHPLEQESSKRRSWVPGRSAERVEPTAELKDSDGKLTQATVHPLARKGSKRTSWFLRDTPERVEPTEELKDSDEKVTQASVHPLERKGSKRRSWFLGHSAEKVEQTERTQRDSEDSLEKVIQASPHSPERSGSKRRSWFLGYSAEKVEPAKEEWKDSEGKLTQASTHPLERKGSKRKSWFLGHSAEKVEPTKEELKDNDGKSTPASVHPLERMSSIRRGWFPGHSAEKMEPTKEELKDNDGKSTPASAHPLARVGSKRRSWFPGHSAERVEPTKEELKGSDGKSTPASVHPLERVGSKRRSWFQGHSADRVERTQRDSENGHGILPQGHEHPLERKSSKRKSWFGGLPLEREERTKLSFEDSHGKITQEPDNPLERKRSKRMSWLGVLSAKGEEKPPKPFNDSKEEIIQKTAEPSPQTRTNRMSWLGGLSTQSEKQTNKTLEDTHVKITQGPTEPSHKKHAKRASWLVGLPSERGKAERRNSQGGEEERRQKRSSWLL
ncbi:hypothetical protein V493_03583 [Pseudogymnoascus sp. VKM F-4281 (FW-2241)]|nr:hypothetical protein V493_03583 [Pseudogymnoascus sp. VKM F-4281 (FW-2241)]